MGVYDRNKNYPDRGKNLWIRYDVDEATRAKFGLPDPTQREPAPNDERAAKAMLAQRRREIRDGTWRPRTDGLSSRTTVAQYVDYWIAKRKAAKIKSVRNDENWLTDYVVPEELGSMPIEDVRRSHLVKLAAQLPDKISKRTGEPLAPRSIHHIYGALRAMFRTAVEEERIPVTPCTLRIRKGELPKKRDKDPRWRMQAIYTRDEIELLISDERVPLQRRVFYALTFFSYTRFGEAAGRQWRDYDAAAKPLGRLSVPTQYEDEDTKTEMPRDVPVHPELARILAEWKLHGFPSLFGRRPTPGDLIVPKLKGTGPQNVKRVWQYLQKDLARLGLRPRRVHDLRRTAISLSIADGADKYLLQWVTHGARKSDAFDLYNTPPWPSLCEQVAHLNVSRKRGTVVQLRRAAGESLGHTSGHTPEVASSKTVEFHEVSECEEQDLKPLASAESHGKTAETRRQAPAKKPGKSAGSDRPATSGARVCPNPEALAEAVRLLRAIGREDLARAVEEAAS